MSKKKYKVKNVQELVEIFKRENWNITKKGFEKDCRLFSYKDFEYCGCNIEPYQDSMFQIGYAILNECFVKEY